MYENKQQLKRILDEEKLLYFSTPMDEIKAFLQRANCWYIWRFQRCLRYCEYYHAMRKSNLFSMVKLLFWRRRKNRLGRMVNLEISEYSVDVGLRIYHPGVVINPNAKIGKNCIIVGNLCIGSVAGKEKAAHIGDNVMFGYGAIIIGNVSIVNGVKIGAGAVLTKSVYTEGATIVGVPGKELENETVVCK